jgi:hypothetical protein
MSTPPKVVWPDTKAFAFSVFDDTDSQTLERCRTVYAALDDFGFRTTKSIWTIPPTQRTTDPGATCDDPEYVRCLQDLQSKGFEIGYHMASATTSTRAETIRALERFKALFGHYPKAMANHHASAEGVYFGSDRLTGLNRLLYDMLTRFRYRNKFRGHIPSDLLFWGDICRLRIRYVRNFTFADVNTLKACPPMPYYDPLRPYVNYWFASSEGAEVHSFNARLSEANQDRLEEEGGACIMYTHFGLGFSENGRLHPRFRELMKRLGRKNGWFVGVSTLLDYLRDVKGPTIIDTRGRARLERRWLAHKLRVGAT